MKNLPLFSKWKDVFKRLSGPGVYPHELAFLLDSPIRKLILSPAQLLDRLHLAPHSIVLEIGPGPGYFSAAVVQKIRKGFLVLFDIQSEMLFKSMVKLKRLELENAYAVRGNAVSLPFGNETFNVVFLVTVLGEVPDPQQCMLSINRVLKTGGLLSITEMKGDADILSEEMLNQLAVENGFNFFEKHSSFAGMTLNYKKVVHI